jgi:hypothetical protein
VRVVVWRTVVINCQKKQRSGVSSGIGDSLCLLPETKKGKHQGERERNSPRCVTNYGLSSSHFFFGWPNSEVCNGQSHLNRKESEHYFSRFPLLLLIYGFPLIFNFSPLECLLLSCFLLVVDPFISLRPFPSFNPPCRRACWRIPFLVHSQSFWHCPCHSCTDEASRRMWAVKLRHFCSF